MRKVFVTGGTGCIGRPPIEALLARGHRVLALARTGDAYHLRGRPRFRAIAVIVAAVAGVAISQGHCAESWGTPAIAAVLYLVALTIVPSALRAIFGVVPYTFAKTGSASAGFDAVALRGAIRPA